MNILFVCLANMQRSPTAEDMVRKRTGRKIKTKSAGILSCAKKEVDREIIEWADRVFVMTEGIKKEILSRFPDTLKEEQLNVLNIKDHYRKGEPRLKRMLAEEFSRDEVLSEYFDNKG